MKKLLLFIPLLSVGCTDSSQTKAETAVREHMELLARSKGAIYTPEEFESHPRMQRLRGHRYNGYRVTHTYKLRTTDGKAFSAQSNFFVDSTGSVGEVY